MRYQAPILVYAGNSELLVRQTGSGSGGKATTACNDGNVDQTSSGAYEIDE